MYDAVRRGVQLRLSLEPGLPPVIGDAVQLQQVVLNLALNAMDAVQASPRASRGRFGHFGGERRRGGDLRARYGARPIDRGAAACLRAVLLDEDAGARDGSRHRAIDRRTTPRSRARRE